MRVYLRKRFFCTSLCHSNADIKPTGQDSAHFLAGNVNTVNSEKIVKSHVWNKTCNLISTEFATRSGSVHKSRNKKMFTTEFLLFLYRFCLNASPPPIPFLLNRRRHLPNLDFSSFVCFVLPIINADCRSFACSEDVDSLFDLFNISLAAKRLHFGKMSALCACVKCSISDTFIDTKSHWKSYLMTSISIYVSTRTSFDFSLRATLITHAT